MGRRGCDSGLQEVAGLDLRLRCAQGLAGKPRTHDCVFAPSLGPHSRQGRRLASAGRAVSVQLAPVLRAVRGVRGAPERVRGVRCAAGEPRHLHPCGRASTGLVRREAGGGREVGLTLSVRLGHGTQICMREWLHPGRRWGK